MSTRKALGRWSRYHGIGVPENSAMLLHAYIAMLAKIKMEFASSKIDTGIQIIFKINKSLIIADGVRGRYPYKFDWKG